MAVRKVVGAVLAKGEHALNRRGEIYTTVTIQEWLALRNFLDELRGTGVQKMHVGEVDRLRG